MITTKQNLSFPRKRRRVTFIHNFFDVISILVIVYLLGIIIYKIPVSFNFTIILAILCSMFLLLRVITRRIIFYQNRKSTYYFYSIIFYFLLLWYSIQSWEVYNIVSYANCWIYALISTSVLFFVFHYDLRINLRKKVSYFNTIIIGIALLLASFASIVNINCQLDQSNAVLYHSDVVDKIKDQGKYGLTYYIKIAPWNTFTEIKKISVSEDLFKKVNINEGITIKVYNGKFGIPWYELSEP